MDALQRAGLRVILITGRPAGWCDHIARMWPVDGVIGENGAFYEWHDPDARKLRSRHLLNAADRDAHTARLAQVRDTILREVPGCAVASWSPGGPGDPHACWADGAATRPRHPTRGVDRDDEGREVPDR